MKATLPAKPFADGRMLVSVPVPKGWSWRIKAAALLIHFASWILGGDVEFTFEHAGFKKA